MNRIIASFCIILGIFSQESGDKRNSNPSFDYDVARIHEIKPHRRIIPIKGVRPGHNQLRLTVIVSPAGDVVSAEAVGENEIPKFWSQLQDEVLLWKFTPFKKDGRAVTAEVEEYIDLVPPERLPTRHMPAPAVRSDSGSRVGPDAIGEITIRQAHVS